jgi:hypothetical protein
MPIYKDECFLGVDDFGRNKIIKGADANAYRIQNLIMMEPGTDPALPEMGIGIKNFQFNLATPEEISTVSALIEQQIAKWLPDIIVDDLVVELLNNETLGIKNTLGIMFKIFSIQDNQSITAAILVNKNNPSTEVRSSLYF